jgi:hypothetical protein
MGAKAQSMGRYRGLLTDTDREYIAREGDVTDSQHYQAISRVRNRIQEETPNDVEVLEEHHPELLAELREIVCEDE